MHKYPANFKEINQSEQATQAIEMASAQSQKPSTTIDVCQPKPQHSSFGQKISEITNKAFKGHHARHGSSQNQLQSYSNQIQVESNGHNGSKTETHHYGQTQTQHDKKHGVTKTHITVCVVQAEITQTKENPSPYGASATTTCFGTQAKKNREINNSKKETNLFRKIKNGMSRHKGEGNSSSSDSESDNEKKCPKTKH
ncbi:uncharacterized protein [Cicer arietinum]|uniref:Uncharacterized protein LOC101501710 n=1 Tax=Cicer arietinum TaxID=3827 RepID=A0A1S2YEH9_CICAR|nr:uncharacterized protein LOC101501710 [Cicer arietinum]